MAADEREREFAKRLVEMFARELAQATELELDDVEVEIEEMEIGLHPIILVQTIVQQIVQQPLQPAPAAPVVEEKFEFEKAEMKRPEVKWTGKIVAVKLGATKSEGGTREVTYTIGGWDAPRLYAGPGGFYRPIISMDVFDTKVPLPRAVRDAIGKDLLDNPPEWARACVEKFGADMVNVHLVSTDPKVMDAPPSQAVKVVEEVLQAVKVPLFIGGSGNPKKDQEVFKAIAEHFAGERLLISPLTLDMKLEEIAPIIKKCNHAVVASVTMDIDKARQLTRKLTTWLAPEDITIDLFGAGIGYGWEYSYSIMERARLAALSGDKELQYPIIAAASNAWAAREAWMKMDEFWGPKEVRGPLWEFLSALTMVLAGADFLLVLHPLTVRLLKMTFDALEKYEQAPQTGKEIFAKWLP